MANDSSRGAWAIDGPTCVSFSGGRTSGLMREQVLFVGYVNARAPLMQGSTPNAIMPRKLRCCKPTEYLHADRLTPEEWGGWWERLTSEP